MTDTVSRADVLAAIDARISEWHVEPKLRSEAASAKETAAWALRADIAALPTATEGQHISAAPFVPEGMACICDACGQRFADRLDHSKTCQGPFPADWWGELDGDVLWWCWQDGAWLGEPPYVGTPLDLGQTVEIHTHARQPAASCMVGGWHGYHTHWTRLPAFPPEPGTTNAAIRERGKA